MPDKDLRRLANAFSTKAITFEAAFAKASDNPEKAFAVISLYAAWEEFSRRLVFSSAAERPFAGNGRVVPRAPGIGGFADVDAKLRQLKRTRPQHRLIVHLGSPPAMVQACNHLDLANYQTISPAILSQNSPADELRLMRNFLAHRNPDTARQVSLPPTHRPIRTAVAINWLDRKLPGGRTQFGVWASDLSDVARACAM